MNIYIAVALAAAGGFIIAWLWFRLTASKHTVPLQQHQLLQAQFNEVQTAATVADKMLTAANAEKQQLQTAHTDLQQQVQQVSSALATLRAEVVFKDEKLNNQQQQIESIGARFEGQFRILANTILEEKSRSFTEQQDTHLKNILEPLRQNIQNFKQEFELRYNDEVKERVSLREQIRYMIDLNRTLSDQANNLTNALRGQVKQQGNWGEMILESILEYAGLQKNIQYFVQQTTQNADGRTIQPDVIVRYPDNRAIVIDAKVSLTAYERYSTSNTKEEQQECLKAMLLSLKAHIDGLSIKAYHDVQDALDFVMMFVPVEAAYVTAMQADTSLWQYAYSKRILLLSPANLIAAMKLVSDMWQRDAVNRDAYKIADKAGKLYDKLVGFVENFERVGQQLDKAQGVWNDAYKQLSKGRGNLISQAEQMKAYKANTNKSLPAGLTENALIEDGQDESATAG